MVTILKSPASPLPITGHSAADVTRHPRLPTPGTGGQVGVRRVNVLRSAKKGRKIGNKYDDERTV